MLMYDLMPGHVVTYLDISGIFPCARVGSVDAIIDDYNVIIDGKVVGTEYLYPHARHEEFRKHLVKEIERRMDDLSALLKETRRLIK